MYREILSVVAALASVSQANHARAESLHARAESLWNFCSQIEPCSVGANRHFS